jgi:leucyl-tRNA synthetase
MELMNRLYEDEASLSRAALDQILPNVTLLLAPFAPFIADELWEQLGRTGPAFRQPWPSWDAELAKEDLLEIPVQVNGKLRAKIMVAIGTPQAELEKLAQADAKIHPLIEGKTIAKLIVVPDKLVNIVVR